MTKLKVTSTSLDSVIVKTSIAVMRMDICDDFAKCTMERRDADLWILSSGNLLSMGEMGELYILRLFVL